MISPSIISFSHPLYDVEMKLEIKFFFFFKIGWHEMVAFIMKFIFMSSSHCASYGALVKMFAQLKNLKMM